MCPNDPALQGMWLGFTWNHGTAHFYRSILESVAYEYAFYLRVEQEQFPDLEFREVRIVGGGAASPVWKQIKADVLGLPYVDLSRSEGSVLGAAIIAGRAAGAFDDVKTAARRFVQRTARTEPRQEMHRVYQPLVDRYVRLLEQAGDLFAAVAPGAHGGEAAAPAAGGGAAPRAAAPGGGSPA